MLYKYKHMASHRGEKPCQEWIEQLHASLQYVFSHVVHKIVICFYDIFTFVTWKIFLKCTMC